VIPLPYSTVSNRHWRKLAQRKNFGKQIFYIQQHKKPPEQLLAPAMCRISHDPQHPPRKPEPCSRETESRFPDPEQ